MTAPCMIFHSNQPSSLNTEETQVRGRTTYHDHIAQTDIDSPSESTSYSDFDSLTFPERKFALNLAQFAQGQADVALSSHGVRNLIQTLTAEAPVEVEKLVTEAEETAKGKRDHPANTVTPMGEEERKDLEALIELAQRRLRETRP